MKPLRIFIFYATVCMWLFFIALLIPRQGIVINSNLQLHFLNVSDLFHKDTLKQEDNLERLLAYSTVTADPESAPQEGLFTLADSFGGLKDIIIVPANADSLLNSISRLEFPEDKPDLLDPFFRKLEGLREGSVSRTRILHFGDSQLENDRMTALIRYRLQNHFGGSGTGLVPAIPLYSGHLAYTQEEEGEWLRYTFFGKRDTTLKHNSYGIMGAFASVPLPAEGTWPSLHYHFNTLKKRGQFDCIRIFMHSYVDSASMAFRVNDTVTDTLRYFPDGFSAARYRHHTRVSDLRIAFDLPQGGRIYGISFESFYGLQMDNIAMRGGSGLIFTKMDRGLQLQMMDQLSPGLILLQYGGNVVPYMDPGYYRRAFRRELKFMQELCPGVPIIVIGPSDMSVKEDGFFTTDPGVEAIRNSLRYASLESGVVFWDLYEAMGGRNSMPSFVNAEPALASTDYVHFTELGVNLVAEMFYNALMLDFKRYSSDNQKP